MPSLLRRCGLLLLAVCLPAAAWAQTVPAVGQPGTLDVATWNVEFFGASGGPSNDDLQRANVAAVIRQAEIDLWGLQEITDEDDFALLLGELGDGFDGVLATNSLDQRIAFVYRTDVVQVRSVKHVLESFAYEFAYRPPLQLEADVTLGGRTETITFIVLHMKANTGNTQEQRASYDRRAAAAQRLKNHIDFSTLDGEPVVVLGDFNDELIQSIYANRASPFDDLVQDADDYRFVTMPLDEDEVATFCGNSSLCLSGSTIDHLLVTDELFGRYVPGSAARYEALLTAIPGYVSTTSDHLPVYARFDLEANVAVQPDAVLPGASLALSVAPQPVAGPATIRYVLPTPAPVQLSIFDMLGRRVAEVAAGHRAAGIHEVAWSADALPAGVYVARLATPQGPISRTFVVLH